MAKQAPSITLHVATDAEKNIELEEQLAELKAKVSRLEDQLEDAKRHTHMPRSIRVERTGIHNKLIDNQTELPIAGYKKFKLDLKDEATATLTVEIDVTDIQFIPAQTSLFDEDAPTEGDAESGALH
jgi:hypothetical protein